MFSLPQPSLSRCQCSIQHSGLVTSSYVAVCRQILIQPEQDMKSVLLRLIKCTKGAHENRDEMGSTYHGSTCRLPGVCLQSRIRSITIANIPCKMTPEDSMRRLASAASMVENVPLASVLAKTVNPSLRRDRAKNSVPVRCQRHVRSHVFMLGQEARWAF